MNNIIKEIEFEYMKKNFLSFRSGDLINIKMWVVEGNKKRLQVFDGIVIAIRRRGLNSSFIVRKVSGNEGVERVFKLYSPVIDDIVIKRKGSVRRSKLYYLRRFSGKSARLKERLH